MNSLLILLISPILLLDTNWTVAFKINLTNVGTANSRPLKAGVNDEPIPIQLPKGVQRARIEANLTIKKRSRNGGIGPLEIFPSIQVNNCGCCCPPPVRPAPCYPSCPTCPCQGCPPGCIPSPTTTLSPTNSTSSSSSSTSSQTTPSTGKETTSSPTSPTTSSSSSASPETTSTNNSGSTSTTSPSSEQPPHPPIPLSRCCLLLTVLCPECSCSLSCNLSSCCQQSKQKMQAIQGPQEDGLLQRILRQQKSNGLRKPTDPGNTDPMSAVPVPSRVSDAFLTKIMATAENEQFQTAKFRREHPTSVHSTEEQLNNNSPGQIARQNTAKLATSSAISTMASLSLLYLLISQIISVLPLLIFHCFCL